MKCLFPDKTSPISICQAKALPSTRKWSCYHHLLEMVQVYRPWSHQLLERSSFSVSIAEDLGVYRIRVHPGNLTIKFHGLLLLNFGGVGRCVGLRLGKNWASLPNPLLRYLIFTIKVCSSWFFGQFFCINYREFPRKTRWTNWWLQ